MITFAEEGLLTYGFDDPDINGIEGEALASSGDSGSPALIKKDSKW